MIKTLTPQVKAFAICCLISLFSFNGFAQVGIGTITPNSNAKLDITSTAAEPGGLLLPRVALTATNSSAPLTGAVEAGMAVYNTATAGTPPNNVTPGYYYNDGSKWVRIAAASGPNENWLLNGNTGTTPGTGANQNYLGTRDNQAIILATNNAQRLRLLANGQVVVNRIAAPASGDRFSVYGLSNEDVIHGYAYGAESAIYGTSTLGGYGLRGRNTGTGKGVLGYGNNTGIGVHGQTDGSGSGVFAASVGTADGLTAINTSNGRAMWVQNSGIGDGIELYIENGTGIYNRILAAGNAGVINDLQAAGGVGELIAFRNRNGVGVDVSAVVNPNNPGVGTAGDVWGYSATIKTNTASTNTTAYGGVMGAEQYGRGHGILMTHNGLSGRNAEFDSNNINNTDPNIIAISKNRASTIVAQNQNNNVGATIAIADISYNGTDGRDHIAISGFSSPVPYYGYGVKGTGGWVGVHGVANGSSARYGVWSTGDFAATGVKNFAIDDPRDPENKILKHASIESNEILNLYRGIETFGVNGIAEVQLPEYYDIININASYQLTPIGASMPNLYIEKEVANGKFVIAGGEQGKKVSWILTAERNDPYLQKYPEKRNMVEDKGPRRGQYLMPELYGQPKEKGMGFYEPQKAEMQSMHTDTKGKLREDDKSINAKAEAAKAIVKEVQKNEEMERKKDEKNSQVEKTDVKEITSPDTED